jgi:hypothetical protein
MIAPLTALFAFASALFAPAWQLDLELTVTSPEVDDQRGAVVTNETRVETVIVVPDGETRAFALDGGRKLVLRAASDSPRTVTVAVELIDEDGKRMAAPILRLESGDTASVSQLTEGSGTMELELTATATSIAPPAR